MMVLVFCLFHTIWMIVCWGKKKKNNRKKKLNRSLINRLLIIQHIQFACFLFSTLLLSLQVSCTSVFIRVLTLGSIVEQKKHTRRPTHKDFFRVKKKVFVFHTGIRTMWNNINVSFWISIKLKSIFFYFVPKIDLIWIYGIL